MSVLQYNDGRDYETSVVYAVFVSVLRLGERLPTTRRVHPQPYRICTEQPYSPVGLTLSPPEVSLERFLYPVFYFLGDQL